MKNARSHCLAVAIAD